MTKYFTHTKFKTKDLAYCAGIIDGEGSFTIYKSSPRKFCARVYVVNTDKRLIEWLLYKFGGLSYKRHHKKWKTRYEWVLEKKDISSFISKLLPFLIIKKQQAETIIKFRKTFPSKRRKLSSKTLSIRSQLYFHLKSLNSRSS